MKKVSVIITTKNEEKNMENILTSLKNQTLKDLEIIVVDNNSTDKTKDISKNFGALVLNQGPERSAQRNFGVLKSTGKYVVILDADMILEPRVLEECFENAHRNPELKTITIREEPMGKVFGQIVKN